MSNISDSQRFTNLVFISTSHVAGMLSKPQARERPRARRALRAMNPALAGEAHTAISWQGSDTDRSDFLGHSCIDGADSELVEIFEAFCEEAEEEGRGGGGVGGGGGGGGGGPGGGGGGGRGLR